MQKILIKDDKLVGGSSELISEQFLHFSFDEVLL